MSYRLFEVKYTPLDFCTHSYEEVDFLEKFRNEEDGTYYIEESILEEAVTDWTEEGNKIPAELVQFLRQKLEQDGDSFSLALV